jgi:hypothetical protein
LQVLFLVFPHYCLGRGHFIFSFFSVIYSKKISAQFKKKLAGAVPGVPALLPGPRPFYFLFNQCNVFEINIRTIKKNKNLQVVFLVFPHYCLGRGHFIFFLSL